MSQIRSSRNRTTEMRLRAHLIKAGISGWTLKTADILGKPDFIFPALKIAVFVDGCFWHVCPKCGRLPLSNESYWHKKLRRNQERDKKNTLMLKRNGWSVIRIWEHEIKAGPGTVISHIKKIIQRAISRTV